MAELLNTKINGTLNVNDYFNIDENGNLTLNSGNNEIFKVGNDGLNLTGNLTVKNGTAFLSTIDTTDDNGVVNVQKPMNITGTLTTSELITANGGLNVNSGNFNSNIKLTVNNNITANSLNIKNGDNDILIVENDNVKINKPLTVNGDISISPNSTGILINKVFDSVMNFDEIIKNSTEYINETIENSNTKNSYLLNLTHNDNFTLEYLINKNRLDQLTIRFII